MTLAQLVTDAYLAYRGKTTNTPAAGDEKYTRILTIANRKQQEWATDPNIDWPSRYEERTLGTVTSGTQVYDMDDDQLRLSDYVILQDSDDNKTYIPVIKAQIKSRYSTGCYVSGFDPKQITFLTPIDASNTGQSLITPCFTIPDDMASSGDLVSVDIPQWLVYITAAELARNDYAKAEQYGNLIGQANDLYQRMIADAQSNSFLQPNAVPNAMEQYSTWGSN